jgi:hypothetical protein
MAAKLPKELFKRCQALLQDLPVGETVYICSYDLRVAVGRCFLTMSLAKFSG